MTRVTLALLLWLPPSASAIPPDYVVTTLAGSDQVGDEGPAVNAFFGALEGVTRGPDGSLYLADTGDHRLRRVTPDGVVHTLAGVGAPGYSGDAGPATAAALNAPYGLALDAAGRLFVADLGNGVVRVIKADGAIATAAGAAQRLRAPRNVAFDRGILYVSEFGGHQISRVNADGSLTPVAGSGAAGFSGDGGPATSAALRYPAGIAFDAAGSLYIADSGNGRVRVVRQGIVWTVAGPGAPGAAGRLALDTPTGVAVDPAGNIYVAHAGVHHVWRIAPDGSVTALESAAPARGVWADAGGLLVVGGQQVQAQVSGGGLQTLYGAASRDFGNGGAATLARLGAPTAVAIDGAGRIAFADTAFDRVRMVDTGGLISSLAADVRAPRGLQFDTAGALFVADSGRHVIQALSAQGTPHVLAGNGSPDVSGPGQATLAAIGDPTALALDAFGSVYFSSGQRVFRLLTSGYLEVVAGTGVAGYNGDGSDATTRQLDSPAGLAADLLGNLYIADTGNHLLRRRTRDAALETVAGALAAGFAGDGAALRDGRFSSPSGLALSATGELWIADAGNQRIRMVDRDGLLHTMAGNGVAGFAGDGGRAVEAEFFNPTALTVAADGVVYVADTGNRRVRALTPPALAQAAEMPAALAVAHAASGQLTAIAPGLLVSLYGSGLGPVDPVPGAFDAAGRLPTLLGGTRVTFNGVAAPLLYAGAGQINAQVPYEIAGSTTVLVEVQRGLPRAAVTVAAQAAAPGLFVRADNTVAALNADGSVNGPAHAAPRGSVVLLFATGDGLENAGLTQAAVTVSIGGNAADVLYAGAAPGFAGLMQINARVPTQAAGALAVMLTVGAVSTAPGPVLLVGP